MPSRRAEPTRASAASGPGQVTSSELERPGSVSEPWARKAPRQAATASQPEPLTTTGRQAADGTVALVDQAGLAGQRLTLAGDPDDVARAAADAAALEQHDLGVVAEDLGDVLAHPSGGGAGVQLGLDDDAAVDEVEGVGEPEHRGDLGFSATGLRDVRAGQFCLHLCRHRHVAHPSSHRTTAHKRSRVFADRGHPAGPMRGPRSPDGPRPRRPRRRAGRRSRTAVGSTRTVCDPQVRGVPEEHVEVVGEVVAPGLVGVRLEVHRDHHLARRTAQGVAQVGHEQVRDHAGVPGPGPEHDPVGLARSPRPPAGRPAASSGSRSTESTSPVVVATSTWPRTVDDLVRVVARRPAPRR